MNEEQELNDAVDTFAAAMKAKLQAKRVAGYAGWNLYSNEPSVRASLYAHIERLLAGEAQEVDCANLLMMLFMFRPKTDALTNLYWQR